jgi:hypothetical protein
VASDPRARRPVGLPSVGPRSLGQTIVVALLAWVGVVAVIAVVGWAFYYAFAWHPHG